MSERLGRKKKGGATLEDLRAAGAARPKADNPREKENIPAEAERGTAVDTLYAVSPKEHADWEFEAARRQRELSITGLQSVGEALREFVELLGTGPVSQIAAEASAALNPDERLAFYDTLAAEELMSVAQVLGLQKGMTENAERPLVATPPYDERAIAAPDAKGISFSRLKETELSRKRRAPYRKLSLKEFERGMERHLSHVPEDAHVEEEFQEANRSEEQSVLPEKQKQSYEDALAVLEKELGAPYGIAYGLRFWKRGDGSAIVLEPDGVSWDVAVGEPHAFGVHGRVVTRFWTEQGFLDKEAARAWLEEKKRLDPSEKSNRKNVSGEQVFPEGKNLGSVIEDALRDAKYIDAAKQPLSREQQEQLGLVSPRKKTEERPRVPDAGKDLPQTLDELKKKFGEPMYQDRVPCWKRPDKTVVLWDRARPGEKQRVWVLRAGNTHNFFGTRKRWTGEEFVDLQ